MKNKGFIAVLVLALVLFIVVASSGPKPIDWSENYSFRSEIPFGGKLVYDRIGDIFPKGEVTLQNNRIVDFLSKLDTTGTNYIIITKDFDPDEYESEKLLQYVGKGNDLFIAASDFNKEFREKLNVSQSFFGSGGMGEDVSLRLDPEIDPSETEYALLRNIYYADFGYTYKHEVLGVDKKNSPVFIRIKWGKGSLIVHSVPLIFSNYYLVDVDNFRYISLALSVLKDQRTYWDEYFKPNRRQVASPLRYVLLRPALRYAWILSLLGVVLFILFRGKRRQRIIPIVAPPANTTLEFAETIGMLYRATGTHKDMAEKKIRFFFDYLRRRFKMGQKDLSEAAKQKLAARTGISLPEISILIEKIKTVERLHEISDVLYLDLCRAIDEFYRKTK